MNSNVDVAPQILENVENLFDEKLKNDKNVLAIYNLVQKNKYSNETLYNYATLLIKHLNASYEAVLNSDIVPNETLYWNIVAKVIPNTIEHNHNLINALGKAIENIKYNKLGLKLEAKDVAFDKNGINSMLGDIVRAENLKDGINKVKLNVEQATYISLDQFNKAQAEFKHSLGFGITVNRYTNGKCCEWCSQQQGSMPYEESFDKDIWRRHKGCKCFIYIKDNGKISKINNYTKNIKKI